MKNFFKIIYDLSDIISSANRAAWLTRRGHIKQAREIYEKAHT
jgi:hypothetical protein